MQIQISWLQKPTDLDLHCLQRQDISGFSRTRVNWPSSINDEAINSQPQVECNLLLDEFRIVSQTVKAVKLLSSGKAPGSDAIPAEIYKAGDPPVAELFHIM